jgi:hypothetical protein
MKKTVLTMAALAMLAGCTPNNQPDIPATPTPTPSVAETQTTKPTEPTTEPTTAKPEPAPETQEPRPEPSRTVEAGTPATQFAQRWGLRYPEIPEYAILKAANGTCLLIEQGGVDWFSDPVIMAGIEEVVKGFDMKATDALEFAQDANQNYCSSIANPT